MPYKDPEVARQKAKERYARNREKYLARQKDYYKKTIEKRRAYDDMRYKRDKPKRIALAIKTQYAAYPKKKKKLNSMRPLDILYSKIIRERDKKCQHCGKTESIQCSHILPRTYQAVRWDLDNAIALCFKCHIYWWHKYPHEAVEWFDNQYPGKHLELKKRANAGVTRTREQVFEDLKATAKLMGIKR